MAYKKIIIYGNNLELFEFEKEPKPIPRRSRRSHGSTHASEDIRADGQDTLSKKQLGKRQDNAKRAHMAFRRIVACNLSGSQSPLLVTLTYKENETDIAVGYRDYKTFVQSLRYKYGKDFKYICVPEFQKRGAVHFHALFWGLPTEVYVQERKTRSLRRSWKRGHVFLKKTDGSNRLSFYLAKYMSKAFIDPRLKNKKAYVASRNIARPRFLSGTYPIWPILDDYQVQETSAEFDQEYETQWLGKCRHRLFKIPDDGVC
ncbi:MAG: hypothetical protein AMXMBFR44_4440 [Candidatus Campbellbacteria bacterium]